MKPGLGMIVKDEVERIEKILSEYAKYFGEIRITITSESKRKELEEVILKYGGVPSFFEWVNDFSKARNFNMKQFEKSKYYFRLDADDKIKNPDKIQDLVDKAEMIGISIVYCWYDYARDEHGHTNAGHYRETIIKCDENLYWNKSVHETILPKSVVGYRTVVDDEIIIVHDIDASHADESWERNIKYLIEEYNRDKDKTDPRTLSYLGRNLFVAKDFEGALFFFQKHIESSGWDEDRYMSWCMMSEIYKQKGDFEKAIACAFEGLAEREDYPDAYLKLHDIYFEQGKYSKAITWGAMGLMKPTPKTFMILDPSSYTWRPMLSMAYCYFKQGEFEKAWKMFQSVQKQVPDLNFVKQNSKLFEDAWLHIKYLEHYLWLFNFTKDRDKSKMLKFFDIIPNEMKENDTLAKLKVFHSPPKWWPDKSIAIYCGNTAEVWADPSVLTGIGGSEEAVIYLSRELVKLGYSVTVFNNCGGLEGTYHGVVYKSFFEFSPKDHYSTLISWRKNLFAEYPMIKAKKKIIWFHDVPMTETFSTKNEIEAFDKIVVLSNYHREFFKNVPDEKIFISTNGINAKDFEKGSEEIKAKKNRCIYASSYDRGLEFLLDNWKTIRAEVPDAELHVFYGWNTRDLFSMAGFKLDEQFKKRIDSKMKQPGVFHHGRVGHKDLVKEYRKSEFFAYPTTFEEINCIALTKAIASGCKAITSDFAAVGERNEKGVAVPLKDYVPTLINAMKGDLKLDENHTVEYIAENSWETVAKSWEEELL